MKLGLGTVQFGLRYGVAHEGGPPPQGEIEAILELAAARGIECLDTAPAYGNSEARLGQALTSGTRFRIVTKTPVCDANEITPREADTLRATFLRSLDNLRQDKLYGLLVHHADELTKAGGDLLVQTMQGLQRDGLVEKLGVSVYDGQQIDRVLDVFRPDIVQLPVNVLDQRLVKSGHVEKLKRRGIEVHARSIFLQGLLLMSPEEVPLSFSPIRGALEDYAKLMRMHGMTRVNGAIAFIRQLEGVDYAIVGAQSSSELAQILEAADAFTSERLNFDRFAVADENMVLPQRRRL